MNKRGIIAVGVDDQGQVWRAHFGMAPWYYLFDEQGELIERRANPYARTQHHDDPVAIVALLPECTTFIARRMGEQSRNQLTTSLRIEPVLTAATDPYQAVQAHLDGLRG